MFNQPPLKYLPPFFKILTLFSLMVLSMQIMFFVGAFIGHQFLGVENTETFMQDISEQAKNPMAALVLQGLGSGLGGFLLPALMFSVLVSGGVGSYLTLNVKPNAKHLLLAIGITLSAGVFISLLVEWNNMIQLPESLKVLTEMQQKYETLIEAFFVDVNFTRFLLLVVVLAVLPALGEELFFRGLVQKILSQTILGNHGAIIVTAIAFALMHFEFFNLFAILWMGITLGYLYFYSQSIWVSIAAHFLNNFLQVLLKYLFAIGIIKTDVTAVETLPLYATLSAALAMFGLLWLLKQNRVLPKSEPIITATQISEHE
jgi:membrane protease YdiL (CAAX protease family)